ncbi:hypothetical protein L21SP2_0934 [Salinispira pacifica]|uniref:Uncharacterized protein n=1 Tax=Salinispira pacifica TaxID=1307761 RepID=V5WFL4_9SPIO|nr:hypothetical protein L21SP2_0934 [Salinispira pacifica]
MNAVKRKLPPIYLLPHREAADRLKRCSIRQIRHRISVSFLPRRDRDEISGCSIFARITPRSTPFRQSEPP